MEKGAGRFCLTPCFYYGERAETELVTAGLGYLYQRFDYDIGNTRQAYPATGDPPVYCPGQTLQYSREEPKFATLGPGLIKFRL